MTKLSPQAVAKIIGLVLTICCAAMTFMAGWTIGGDSLAARWTTGLTLACISIGVAIGLHFVAEYRASGHRVEAAWMLVFWAALLFTEFSSQSLFMVGHQAANVSAATVQDTVYTDTRDSLTEQASQMATLEDRLAKLKSQNPWTAGVTADGLKAKLASADKAIELEAAKGGCKDKCLSRMRERDDLKAQIATITETVDIGTRIAATQKLLDQSRTAASKVAKGDSVVAASSSLFAQIGTGSLKPGNDAVEWATIGRGTWLSMIVSIAAAVWIAVGWRTTATPNARPATPMPADQQAAALMSLHTAMTAPSTHMPVIQTPGLNTHTGTVIERHFSNNGLTKEAIAGALASQGLLARAA